MSRRKKRFWSDEEKREICAQATTPGISVAQVARRYAVNANLIFKWLKDPRFAPKAEVPELETMFLPIEIEADVAVGPAPIDAPMPSPSAPLSASRVDITLSDGRRILIEGPTALTAVVSLVQGLAV
ncbi:IS66-like element accessory protein TnpA [Cognatiyoonia sp. IB215182]|uniref:IS66-like element accessory protein TnpA n=1 Tax=Cognatiyoonia sp. IB215182 TaxID=3097353 RepID=UPI002A0EC718|nr:transposase [Cognatiyoonia sp. IB215182]MDX8355666.1 transposase [Cognatiyoonia sp. IB215182]